MFKSLNFLFIFNNKNLHTKTDLHSHLIPQIDDGCKSIEESVLYIKELKKLGYTKLITTPHIMLKKYPNNTKIIRQGLLELRSHLIVQNIDIEVEAAAEYFCDEYFLSLIKKKEILFFGGNYVLFELAYTKKSLILEKIIKLLIEKGYKPVLAHPERYRFLTTVIEYRQLKKMGLLFQVNVNSIGGYYGKEAQKKGLMLSTRGMIDFIGSDIHHQKHMDSYKEAIFSNHMDILFRNNKILNDNI